MSWSKNCHIHCLNAMRHGADCDCVDCQLDYMNEQHKIMGEMVVRRE